MSESKALGERPLIERALTKAAADPDLPSMGRAASMLCGVDLDRQSIESLCEIALSDPGLAQKIVRAASAALVPGAQRRSWNLSKAIVALGVEQVRAMAMALSLLEVGHARAVDARRARKAVGEALQACFCAREVAKAQGLDKDSWGLRALFLGALPFFLELYDSILAAKISLACAQNHKPWGRNLKAMCGLGEAELLDRFMSAWRFPQEARRVPEGDALMAEWALASARALAVADQDAGALALGKAFLPWDERERLKAAEGLAKGTGVGALCGAPHLGALNQQEAPSLAGGRGWEEAGARWLEQAEKAVQLAREAAKAAQEAERLAKEEAAAAKVAQILAKEEADPLAQAAARLSAMVEGKALRSEVAAFGLLALSEAFGMERSLCAYGERAAAAKAQAWIGAGPDWARGFVSARNRGGMDLFGYAIARGVDSHTWDAKEGSHVSPELALEGEAAPKAFAFISLSVKGRPRGYALLVDACAKAKPSARSMERARHFCDRWAQALAASPETL